ncbi:MAG: hypothetical protein J6Q69_05240 [Clostridia bacterium]|nr:hypothetical protein [Clostridia bacterium]
MIKEFSAQPKAQNNKAKIVMAVSFLVAAVAFVTMVMATKYRGVIGLVSVGAIITGILMYTKYISVKFFYDVLVEGYDEPMLVVRQLVGKRNVTLARIYLADVCDIKHESAAERRAHKRDRRVRLYVFGPTLSPSESYRVYTKSHLETSELVLEGSSEFFEMLRGYVAEAKELRAKIEEEEEY